MSDVRIYLSFDLEHDRDLHDLLLAQFERSAFAVASQSKPGEMTEQWAACVRSRISSADQVVVICGEHTDESPRVSAELEIAREEKKPYLLLWGRRERMCKKPTSARNDDGMYSWTAAILEYQLDSSLRRSRRRDVPESLKRQAPGARSSPPS